MAHDDDDYISPEESGLSRLVTGAVTKVAAEETPQPSAAAATPVPETPSPGTGDGAQAQWEAYKARGDRSRKPLEPVQMPEGWTLHDVAKLVGDIAANMYELPYILKKNNINEAQYDLIAKSPFFKKALEAEIITWQGANSIQKRLALEAAIAVETSMPQVAARLTNKSEPLGEVVALMKLFAEMAGSVGNKAAPVGGGSDNKIRITINLGGHTMARDASPALEPKVIEHDAG